MHGNKPKKQTLYRIHSGYSLTECVAQGNSVAVEEVIVGGRPAILISAQTSGTAKWQPDVRGYTGVELHPELHVPGALVLLELASAQIWALSWGSGYRYLDPQVIDDRFGPRLLARVGAPDAIRSLMRTALDPTARTDRSYILRGGTLSDLGVEGTGEVISTLEGQALSKTLPSAMKAFSMVAGTSVRLPLARTGKGLVKDLDALGEALKLPVREGMEHIEQLEQLSRRDSQIPALDELLANALVGGLGADRLSMVWPAEAIDSAAGFASLRITGTGDGQQRILDELPELAEIQAFFVGLDTDQAQALMKSVRIRLFDDVEADLGHDLTPPIQLTRWLLFEVQSGKDRFCFYAGRWYRMDSDYAAQIDRLATQILGRTSTLGPLPIWTSQEDEQAYNLSAATALQGVCLDRNLVRTSLHPRGFEACDIYVPGSGACVHVKKATSSQQVSHLLAQALVATESLIHDPEARRRFTEKVNSGHGSEFESAPINEVVIALGSAHEVTAESLFTFSKVNLVRQVRMIQANQVEVRIESIQLG